MQQISSLDYNKICRASAVLKKTFKKMFSNKKVNIGLAIVACFGISYGIYAAVTISQNIKKMHAIKDTDYYPAYPVVNTPVNTSGNTGNNSEIIKRGEYLAKAGDCIACHTNTSAKGKPFAGGLAMVTPFGTIYSPNITPDKTTGIGNWTNAQFIKAMHDGISPHNSYYYPAFPYLYFNKISDDDLKAIRAYLNSIPAVHQANRGNAMMWPLNIRFLQVGWRTLFFRNEDTDAFQPNPHQPAEWNRGAYLVQGLGHCAMCHSPYHYILKDTLSLGAPIRKYDLTGAKIQGYLAPNITKANLGKVQDKDIVDVFTRDHLIGGGKIQGPMLEVDHDSLKYLSHSDLLYIAYYLKNVQSQTPPKPKGGPGKATYEGSCSGCHATGSGGSPKYGDANAWDPILKDGIAKVYLNAIHGMGNMPAKGSCLSCSDDDIKQAVDYMVAAVQAGGRTASTGARRSALTMIDGKHIYQKNCSVCHSNQFGGAPKPGDIDAWKPIVNTDFMVIFENVALGKNHPPRGACPSCSDAELKAAVKYMLQKSTTDKDYSLW